MLSLNLPSPTGEKWDDQGFFFPFPFVAMNHVRWVPLIGLFRSPCTSARPGNSSRFSSVSAGVSAEGDAGNAICGHLVGRFHCRFGHRLLANQGSHVRRHVDRCAVPLQVCHNCLGKKKKTNYMTFYNDS